MKNRLFILLLMCVSVAIQANAGSKSLTQDTLPAKKKWIVRVAEWYDNNQLKGVDTNYIALPKHRFRVSINGEFGGVHTMIKCSDAPYYGDITGKFHSNIMPKLGFVISYRNINIGHSWDLSRGYSNFRFSALQNGWGVEIYRRKTGFARGYLDASSINGRADIANKDITTTTLFTTAYVALNPRKFSMPAAFNASFIQKKSAGSPLIVGDFIYSKMAFQNDELIAKAKGMREMEFYQIAIGAGYGYNYTPNEGKFLLHVSVTPMLAFFNRMVVTGNDSLFNPDKTGNQLVVSRKIKPKSPVYVTGQAKLALVYNITPRFVLAFNGVVNNMRFWANDKLVAKESSSDEYPNIKMRMMTWDWNASLFFGVRFL